MASCGVMVVAGSDTEKLILHSVPQISSLFRTQSAAFALVPTHAASQFRHVPQSATLYKKKDTIMSRGRVYANGWQATVRYAMTAERASIDVASLRQAFTKKHLTQVDCSLRHKPSIQRFTASLDYDSARSEAVFRIAALRVEPTDRADCAILRILHLLFPPRYSLARGKWVDYKFDSEEDVGFKLRAFVDYSIIEEKEALALMRKLQDKVSADGFVTSTDLPIIPPGDE